MTPGWIFINQIQSSKLAADFAIRGHTTKPLHMCFEPSFFSKHLLKPPTQSHHHTSLQDAAPAETGATLGHSSCSDRVNTVESIFMLLTALRSVHQLLVPLSLSIDRPKSVYVKRDEA